MAHGEGGSTMGSKIGTIFMAIIVIGVVVYFWNSGLINKGAGGIESLFPPIHVTSTASFSSTPPGFGGGIGVAAGGVTGDDSLGVAVPHFSFALGTSPVPNTTIAPFGFGGSEPPSGFTAAQLSPYYREINIGSAYSGFGQSGGSISITAFLPQNETVDVTGWELKSNRGGEFIPQAVEVYEPSGFAPEGDIRLGSGQTLDLYSGSGPINLRLNECIGYMQQDLNTNPRLPLSCPTVNRSQIENFSGACQNYIQSIPSCTVPTGNSIQIPQNDYACQQFLTTLNYAGCFSAHVNDANFLSNQWWAWTGSTIADPYHDTINLFDRNGLLVAQYSY